MSKSVSTEKKAFYHSMTFVMLGFSFGILLVLSILYCVTLYVNKDSQSMGILDIIKIFIGVLMGSIATGIAERHYDK